MLPDNKFINCHSEQSKALALEWFEFLNNHKFDFNQILNIDMASDCPIITDPNKNKFSIDFKNNKKNYHKTKTSIKSELISRALGSGRISQNVLDLSAGLGIDAVFLAQLGYHVTAIERNPLIYLCLQQAKKLHPEIDVNFIFGDSKVLLSGLNNIELIYFDPMFPEKEKSALPRQEMVFFKSLVGADDDASDLLKFALQANNIKRVVVKRPLKAKPLLEKVSGVVEGKLVRYDIYGVSK